MIKKLLLVMIFTISCTYGQQTYMQVKLKGGGITSFSIQDIQKITFNTTLVGVKDDKIFNVIKTFTLLQNYPNPFNPTTIIEYELPKAGMVDVKVYDINGRLVRSVLGEHQELGAHQIRWDSKNDAGASVASGVYFYQIRFAQSVLSRKMLLLK
ncbi:MAG: FlgD immunoglobulin-like domain containing protein [Bacteroidota bacterium]|nr:FlgD immunoglobulin-like domain containing protein [Bacteroidota bacterium]